MDIDLGEGIDGTEAAKQILKETDLPVVFLSSYTSPEIVEKTEKITSYGYIVKDSGIAVIDASIKMALKLFDAKKEAEEQKNKLEESEDRFQKLMNVVPDMISIQDTDMNILYSNWKGVASVPQEKRILNTKCYKTYRGYENICPDCNAIEVLKSKKAFQKDAKLPDNTWVDLRVMPIFDDNNNIELFVEWVRDITERKNTEESLKQRETELENQNYEYQALNEEYETLNEELHHINEKLAHSRDLMQYIIEHNRSAVALHDKDLNYIYVSQRYLDVFKVKDKNIIGKHHYEVFPDLPQKWRDVHQKALKGKVSSAENDPYYKEDGTVEWTRWECRPWYEYDGSIGGFIIYTEVITDRINTEKALQESEKRLDQAMSVKNEGIWDWNLITNETYFDDRYYTMAGYKPREFPHNIEAWASRVHHEDLPRAQKEIKEYLSGKSPVLDIEFRFKKKDGTWMWINGKGKIVERDSNDEPLRMIGTHTDITDQKRAEQALKASEKKYRNLLENAFDGIYLLNGDSFEYVNKQFCKLTGYTYSELFDDNFKFSQLLTEESKKIVEQRYNEWRKDIKLDNVYELQIKTKTGKIRNVEVSTTPVKDNKQPMVLGIIRDITEIKKAQQLEREVSIARQAADFKQKFLANMSHEIRTPLSGMLGFIDLLADTNPGEDQKVYIDTLRQSGENLKEIINLILDYSKIESGKVTIKNKTFSIKSLFENITTLFNSICHDNIELKTNISSKLPKYIITDEQRLYQVLSNLVSNAAKFTEEGRITINAKPALTDEQAKESSDNNSVTIKIEVIDTGPGIKPEAQKDLFKPFSQEDTGEVRNIEGTGLGLSICKELVTMLEGEIGVKSKHGEGSNFWFTFKAKVGQKPEIQQSKEKEKEKEKTKKIPSLNVLLVDDRKINQTVAKLMIRSGGHNVDLADNGEEAIKKFQAGNYDIILMDIQMPVMDGVTATKELKKNYKNVPPIVGLSAHAMEGDREKYMQKGMDEYLIKPIKNEDFEDIVQKLKIVT